MAAASHKEYTQIHIYSIHVYSIHVCKDVQALIEKTRRGIALPQKQMATPIHVVVLLRLLLLLVAVVVVVVVVVVVFVCCC